MSQQVAITSEEQVGIGSIVTNQLTDVPYIVIDKHLDSTAHFMLFYLVKTFRKVAPTPLVLCKEVELKELKVLYTVTVDTPRTPTYEALQLEVKVLRDANMQLYKRFILPPDDAPNNFIRKKLREVGQRRRVA